MVYYLNVNNNGLLLASSVGNGNEIELRWATAYPTNRQNKIAYNIYMSENIVDPMILPFFNKIPDFVSVDGATKVKIIDLVPGKLYHFAVRGCEYNEAVFDLKSLPIAYNGLVVYPKTLLRQDISATDLIIPLIDAEQFPVSGTIKIGAELINYQSVDTVLNNLMLNSIADRGYNNSTAYEHTTDGYDGYVYWSDEVAYYPIITEEPNTRVFECWNRFDINNYQFTDIDGYHQRTIDILTTDMTVSDAVNAEFPSYDYAGYHRTDPVALLRGDCIGTYIGGYMGCVDGYNGVGRQIRGVSIADQNTQRQEELLSTTGKPVCLIKRMWKGITCHCFTPGAEYPSARCYTCFGTGFVVGYRQFFYNKRSDGRIMMRFDPTTEDLIAQDSGLESTFAPNAWTLNYPSIIDRDIIVRFDQDGNEEFRYEVLNVTRNAILLGADGGQKLALQRIRKTDIIYQIPVFRDTGMFPRSVQTSIESSNGIPLHQHTLVFSEKFPINAQQLTTVNASHNHKYLYNPLTGFFEVSTELGHNHELILV